MAFNEDLTNHIQVMRGWLVVEQPAASTDNELAMGVARGVAVAESLPPK
jgi:hypothetical protein